MDLMDLLQGQLSGGMVDQLSQALGGAEKEKTAKAASGITSLLMGALAKNAASPEGASALSSALDRDHDGSILNDVIGMVTGANRNTGDGGIDLNRMLNGAGILKHVLGGKQSGAIDMISKMSGLDSSKTGSLMTMLAPVIMGALGKAKRDNNLDSSGISDLLTGSVKRNAGNNPLLDLATKFLDQDGDGSIMDDLASMGMKMLGGLFGRK
ncbi:MAG: DUF937 domain-containing protein [Saprospiraceae bacterium]|nr:DUF937 domain-containing protein [Lewinella sp.]